MIVIGLTGSIGMGKSTAADMLRDLGVSVHDSDRAVHDILAGAGTGLDAVRAAFPSEDYPDLYKGDGVDRGALGGIVFGDKAARKTLEEILHPLVRMAQQDFLKAQEEAGADMAALEVPLLFEVGSDAFVDVTIVVDAPYEVQRARVLARSGMTEEKFQAILERQMDNAEKAGRADYVVRTDLGRAQTQERLKEIIEELRAR